MRSAQIDGLKLQVIREDQGLTTVRLAAHLSDELGRRVWPSTITRIERGHRQPGPELFAAMCRVLKCERSALIVFQPEAKTA